MNGFDIPLVQFNSLDASSLGSFSRALPPSPISPSPSQQLSSAACRTETNMSKRDQYRTPPSHTHRYFDASSNDSSDDASEDGDEIPQTPADANPFYSIDLAPQSKRRTNGVELSQLFATRGTTPAQLEDDESLSLSPIANVFYPSFGDFLPSVKKQEEEALRTNGLGLRDWEQARGGQEEPASTKIDSLSRALAVQLALDTTTENARNPRDKQSHVSSPATESAVFAPFATFSPNTDSFTFFPSPDWKSSKGGRDSRENAQASSADLLSPRPDGDSTLSASRKSPPNEQSTTPRGDVIVTPPVTPSRNSSLRPVAPPMQQSRSLPIPTSLSPSRSPFAAAPSPSPTRTSFSHSQLMVHQHLPPFPPYPLSPMDTERIAKLHNGRIPTLEQLCPEPVHPSAQPPIVNTGNQGVMVVQQGDWKCGTCSFVNWRRRKICLRCFPFANDIGNILTIQSQRAAHLAVPMSAPAHQTQFLLPSPTRAHFEMGASTGMARTASYNAPSARSAQSYLFVPPHPTQVPHSASPTRTTFSTQSPSSPNRYVSAPSRSSLGSHSMHYQYHSQDDSRFLATPPFSPSSATSGLSPITNGDLAIRRAAKLQNCRKGPSIQPLSLANYNQQMDYAQTAPVSDRSPAFQLPSSRGGDFYVSHSRQVQHQMRDSPPSPTRLMYHPLSQPRNLLSSGSIGAEL